MVRIARIALILVALACISAGCGGGSGGDSSTVEPGSLPAAQSFFPLKVDNEWVWQLRTPDTPVTPSEVLPDRQTAKVVGTREIAKKEWFELEVTDWLSTTGEPVGGTRTILMRETAEGVYLYYDLLETGLKWLDRRAAVGARWNAPQPLTIWWELVGTGDTVHAPNEAFAGCWHVKEHIPGNTNQEEVWERWFKRGVGLVLERFWGEDGTAWDDKVLLEYHVQP
ncbi:MAG: hypothetical protein N2512_14225 [Armatimonadetes bacterium]|nr:hypothetical protein [Armatimonadota bacterium]